MGRYVLTPDIFDKINEAEPGVGGEIQLTDALQNLDSFTELNLKVRPMTSATDLNGSRHQSNLHWMMMSLGMIWWSI